MKKVYSIAAVIMALVMMLTLCSCDQIEDAIVDEVIENIAEDAANDDYTRGTVTETTWESEFLGLKFECNENYVMSTTDELDAMIDFGGELVYSDEESYLLDYAKAVTVYEMSAVSIEGIPNVMASVEKIPLSNMTEAQYLEALESQFANLSTAEISYEVIGTSSAQVAGLDFSVLSTYATSAGITMNQDYYVRKYDDRMLAIIVTYAEDYGITDEEVLSFFSAY